MEAKPILAIIGVVLAVIIIFTMLGHSTTEITSAADSAQYPSNCSDGLDSAGQTLTFNSAISATKCLNSTGTSGANAKFYSLPFSSFLGSGGIVMMGFMIAFVIYMVVLVLKKKK